MTLFRVRPGAPGCPREPYRTPRPERGFLPREVRNSVGSVVNGVERHSTMSACDKPTAKSDRSSTSSRGLIADRISNDAASAMPWLAAVTAHFVIMAISISLGAAH